MLTTLSKRLVILLGAAPLLLSAAAAAPQQKVEHPCEQGCPLWGMEEMENFFNRPFHPAGGYHYSSSMKETNKAYLISIDLPGMDKKDISIETAGNRLMISGERKEESESKESTKRSYREFKQSYHLPEDANLEAITATSLNGVLKITVPKSPGKKTSKKIEIK